MIARRTLVCICSGTCVLLLAGLLYTMASRGSRTGVNPDVVNRDPEEQGREDATVLASDNHGELDALKKVREAAKEGTAARVGADLVLQALSTTKEGIATSLSELNPALLLPLGQELDDLLHRRGRIAAAIEKRLVACDPIALTLTHCTVLARILDGPPALWSREACPLDDKVWTLLSFDNTATVDLVLAPRGQAGPGAVIALVQWATTSRGGLVCVCTRVELIASGATWDIATVAVVVN